MKKIVALLVIAVVAMPAMAATTISCAQVGGSGSNTFTVSYSDNGVAPAPRAFALDITTSTGTITGVTATKTGESTSGSKGFGIFPGTINIDSANGTVTDVGSPVAPNSDLPSGTLGGIGTVGATVELGSLYADSTGKPATSGTLVTVTLAGMVQGASAKVSTITIVGNTARGGLVLEDASTVAPSTSCTVTVPALPVSDCFASSLSTYARWTASGKPSCWCPPTSVTGFPVGGTGYQCMGDVAQQKEAITGYRVYTPDLNAMSASWKKVLGASGYNACADVAHQAEAITNYGVYTPDLNRMSTFWKKTDAQLNVTLGIGTGGGYCGQATVPAAYK
jgi:hypothetical protein